MPLQPERPERPECPEHPERGSGLIGTVAGITVFLAFLLFAVQLLVNLYSASVVTSAAYDAARRVAVGGEHPPSAASLGAAEEHARGLIGAPGDDAVLTWDLSDPDVVALRIEVANPRVLLGGLGGALGFDTVDRTVRVRTERSQDE